MDLKVAFVIVSLCAFAIPSTEGGIPKCCIRTKRDIPIAVLRKVQSWDVQQSIGACDIPALVLHVRGKVKPVCAHPKIKEVLERLRLRMKQSRQKVAY
uniref:C-C motif chemokine 27a n=1 Tax=Scatophagus argus TaxID=75038 RepID=UPI001ED84B87|nr:C-C motif chemokine 27a [Scatophagus argus]